MRKMLLECVVRKALIACSQEFAFNRIYSVRSPKKKLFLISDLEHSHLIDCTRELHLGALRVRIYYGLRVIKMIKEQIR